MSGVYIKDMEMPQSCTLCALLKNDRSAFYCPVQSKEANLKANLLIELYANCPLTPVPDHGDLIDRNVLMEKRWDADTRCGYVQVIDVGDVVDAPTIIMANKEKNT